LVTLTLVLLLLNVTDWSLLLGVIVAVSCPVCVRTTDSVAGVSARAVVRRAATVTAQVAVNVEDPCVIVTVIVAEPTATAATVPLFTVATAVSLLDHAVLKLVAVDGATVAVSTLVCVR
jgi:hypothetical protein